MESDKIKIIYNLLGDYVSKYIFENRLMYSLTEETQFIRNVACTVEKVQEIYDLLKSSDRKKVIFGVGNVGKRLVRIYDDIEFECFVDNNCAGQEYRGLSVIDMQELKEKHQESLIIISTNIYHKEILEQLLKEGFKKENIVNIGAEYEKLNHRQYFDLPYLEDQRADKEIFVDGGCFDGSTALDFAGWCLPGGGYIYAWEPDPYNQKECRRLLEKSGLEYELIAKGLWNEEKELCLTMSGGSSRISADGVAVKVDSIDHAIGQPVTFIKMDIEGAEYQALLGAEKTILKYKPKLAVCVYHKPEDIWELPWLIHKLNPKYRFYFRHYSFGDVETVLYAL